MLYIEYFLFTTVATQSGQMSGEGKAGPPGGSSRATFPPSNRGRGRFPGALPGGDRFPGPSGPGGPPPPFPGKMCHIAFFCLCIFLKL